jgi:hypothetical protein
MDAPTEYQATRFLRVMSSLGRVKDGVADEQFRKCVSLTVGQFPRHEMEPMTTPVIDCIVYQMMIERQIMNAEFNEKIGGKWRREPSRSPTSLDVRRI